MVSVLTCALLIVGAGQLFGQDLEVWFPSNVPEVVKVSRGQVEDFEMRYNVKAKFAIVDHAEFPEKIATAIAAGRMPNLFGALPTHYLTFQHEGYIKQIDDLVEEMQGEDPIEPGYLDILKMDGHFYGVPMEIAGGGTTIWYRTDIFAKYGLAIPTDWDQLLNLAAKITDAESGLKGFSVCASVHPLGQWFPEVWMNANDTSIFNAQGEVVLDGPEAIETCEFLRKMYAYCPDSTGYSWAEYKMDYWKGRVAMLFYWNSLAPDMEKYGPEYQDKTSNFALPRNKGKQTPYNSNLNMDVWMISKDTTGEQFDLAKKFIKMYYEPQYYVPWLFGDPADFTPVTMRILSPRSSWWGNKVVQQYVKEVVTSLRVDSVPFGWAYYKHHRMGDLDGSLILAEMFQEIITTDDPIKDIVEYFLPDIEDILAGR